MLYVHGDEYERLGREAYSLLARGGIYRGDLPARRRDGSLFWARVVGQAIDPDATESIWIIDDIDREKALEQELRRAGEAADAPKSEERAGVGAPAARAQGCLRIRGVRGRCPVTFSLGCVESGPWTRYSLVGG